MNIWQDTNWFAINSKAGQESLVAANLERMKLEVLLPKRECEKLVWGVPYRMLKPLFPRYLFARFCPATHLHLIRYARGVSRIISALDLPLPVDEEIIRLIQLQICAEGYVKLEPQFQPGQKVEVRDGMFQGLKGIFERDLNDRERVILLLEAIEYQARIVIEKRHLKAAEAV